MKKTKDPDLKSPSRETLKKVEELFSPRKVILHDGVENPVIYFHYEDGLPVWVEMDPKDIGICDEDCYLFKVGDCQTDREDGYCMRAFKPPDKQSAEEAYP